MLALIVVVVVGGAFFLRPRSLPPPPLRPPRFVARAPRHARPPAEPGAGATGRGEPDVEARADTPGPARDDTAAAPTPAGRRDARPRVAIVIDDLGDSLESARAVLALEPAVTMAIIPFRADSARVAAAAVEHGREVILHLPLEPEHASEMGGAPGFLRTSMSADGLERQLEADLAAVPYIVGVNGHMGSRFTQDPVAMERLLVGLRGRGLFYLDSLTTSASVAAATAARVGLPFAQRALFLDHDPSPAAVARALEDLDGLAHSRREVIAIGHPHRTTLDALGPWLAHAVAAGIHVVPASALVR